VALVDLCFRPRASAAPVQAEAPPQAREHATAHPTSSTPHRPPPVELGRQRRPRKPNTTRTTTTTPMIQKILFIPVSHPLAKWSRLTNAPMLFAVRRAPLTQISNPEKFIRRKPLARAEAVGPSQRRAVSTPQLRGRGFPPEGALPAGAIFDNFDDFRRLHPAFEALSVAGMAHAAGRAPVHAGAVRYYREHGWLP
jgi:hypothetical protein